MSEFESEDKRSRKLRDRPITIIDVILEFLKLSSLLIFSLCLYIPYLALMIPLFVVGFILDRFFTGLMFLISYIFKVGIMEDPLIYWDQFYYFLKAIPKIKEYNKQFKEDPKDD